jgi:hypothetical protein
MLCPAFNSYYRAKQNFDYDAIGPGKPLFGRTKEVDNHRKPNTGKGSVANPC